MLAYDFPLLSLIVVIVTIAVVVVVVFAIIWALIDNFRRHDHGGWAKAGWLILIALLPLIGAVIYYIARPTDAEMSYSQ